LILNGEMSEWSIEHAWKAIRWSESQAHRDTVFAVASTIWRRKLSLGIRP
jgi:hypothetical protein